MIARERRLNQPEEPDWGDDKTCKDCALCNETDAGSWWCKFYEDTVDPDDDFCSDGEQPFDVSTLKIVS